MSISTHDLYLQIYLSPTDDISYPYSDTPYFWCIFERTESGTSNEGCGWSKSPQQAFYDAYSYFQEINLEYGK